MVRSFDHTDLSVSVPSISLFLPHSASRHIRVYLPPINSGTPNSYCSKALEFQALLIFNEVFRIPVQSSTLTLKSLQLYVCAVAQQLQEELLVRTPPSLPPSVSPESVLISPPTLCTSLFSGSLSVVIHSLSLSRSPFLSAFLSLSACLSPFFGSSSLSPSLSLLLPFSCGGLLRNCHYVNCSL